MDYTDLDIKTIEEVYPVLEDSELAAQLLMEYLKGLDRKDMTVLDMGTGTGILGMTAAVSGKAARVVFADINKNAVDLVKYNTSFNKAKFSVRRSLSFVESDLFSNIAKSERFDLIVFNAPYLPDEGPRGESEIYRRMWNGGKTGVDVTIAFIREAALHLNEEGAVMIVTSSFSEEGKVYGLAEELGLSLQMRRVKHIFFEDITAAIFTK